MHSILRKILIVLGLFQYKYWSEYLSCGRLQWERTGLNHWTSYTVCQTVCQVITWLTGIVQ